MDTGAEWWRTYFDEEYLATFAPRRGEDASPAEALAAVALAGLAPGADVLGAPRGFGRPPCRWPPRATASSASPSPRSSWPRRGAAPATTPGRTWCTATPAP